MNSKFAFLLRVLNEHGILVWFEGKAPKDVGKALPPRKKETVKQWSKRVLQRNASDLTVMAAVEVGGDAAQVMPQTRMSTLATDEMAKVIVKLVADVKEKERSRYTSATSTRRRALEMAALTRRAENAEHALVEVNAKLAVLEESSARQNDKWVRQKLSSELDKFLDKTPTLDDVVSREAEVYRKGLLGDEPIFSLVHRLIALCQSVRAARKKDEVKLMDCLNSNRELRAQIALQGQRQ